MTITYSPPDLAENRKQIGDMIFVSMENWDEVWRRNQFLCAGLARRFPEMKILFVGTPRNVSHGIRSGSLSKMREKATAAVPGLPNITVTRPVKLMPNSLRSGRRMNEAMARAHVRRVSREIGIKRPLLWLNPHSAVHMAGRMGERAVVYDITDDWSLATVPPWEKQLILDQDAALCKRADLVIVCSEALEKSRRSKCSRILLLPNGVDPAHYTPVSQPVKTRHAEWPSPVLGYTGTLHADRVDVDLLIGIARSFSDGAIVLIGPNCMPDATTNRLKAESNIKLMGEVPYSKLPEYMARFDVCIVPHNETPFTESLNPIKLWEYLAGGKPIVSTKVAGFRDYPSLCHIASGVDAFAEACKAALKEDIGNSEKRIAEASMNSWDRRIDCLLSTLEHMDVPV